MLTNLRAYIETGKNRMAWGIDQVEITVGLKNGAFIEGEVTEEHLYYLLAHLDGITDLTYQAVDGAYERQELPVRTIRIQHDDDYNTSWTIVLLSEVVTVTPDRGGTGIDEGVARGAHKFWGGITEIERPSLPSPEVPWSPDFVPDPEMAESRASWAEDEPMPLSEVGSQAMGHHQTTIKTAPPTSPYR